MSAGWPATGKRRLAWCAGVVVAASGLFACYLLQARTYPVNSDGGSNALQAWDMLHGNVLLHGWWLSDVSFYTTELPQYAGVEAIFGLRPEVIDVSAAMTYTLLVVLAALVAKGQARGREGVLRALLAGGIMAAPALGLGTYAVLSSPDHTGTGVPVMLILLLLDRLDRQRIRWLLPPLVLVLLVWVQVADSVAVLAVTIPVIVVGVIRAVRSRYRNERPWHDLQLAAAALASVPVAAVVLAALRASGGFYLHPYPGPLLASPSMWPGQARILGQCVLVLFGADVIGQPFGMSYGFALLHMAGVAAAAIGLLAGVAGFFRRLDRVSQILVVSVLTVLAAAQFSQAMTSLLSVREIATVLPAAAALAGRVIGPAVPARAIAVFLGTALAALGFSAAQPAVAAENQQLAGWLMAHNLRNGLAGYWQADSLIVDSGGRIAMAPIFGSSPYPWESRQPWYDAQASSPDFVVTVSSPFDEQAYARPSVVRGVFGRPERIYHFQRYTIWVYRKNLLADLQVLPQLPASATLASGQRPAAGARFRT